MQTAQRLQGAEAVSFSPHASSRPERPQEGVELRTLETVQEGAARTLAEMARNAIPEGRTTASRAGSASTSEMMTGRYCRSHSRSKFTSTGIKTRNSKMEPSSLFAIILANEVVQQGWRVKHTARCRAYRHKHSCTAFLA